MKGATLNIREALPTRAGLLPQTVPNKSLATDANGKVVYVDPVIGDLTAITPVDTVAINPITLSGLQDLAGVTGAPGLRVWVMNQLDRKQNGVLVMAAGAWARAADFSTGAHFDAAYGRDVLVRQGLWANARGGFLTPGPVTVGSTEIVLGLSPNPPGEGQHGKFMKSAADGSGRIDYVDGVGAQAAADVVFLTAPTLSGVPAPYDDITLEAGDVALIVAEDAAPEDRGLWLIQAGVWVRTGDEHVSGLTVTVRYGGFGRGTQWTLLTEVDFVLDDPSDGEQVWKRSDGGPTGKTATASTAETLLLQVTPPLGCHYQYKFEVRCCRADGVTLNRWIRDVDGITTPEGVTTLAPTATTYGVYATPNLGAFDLVPDGRLIEVFGQALAATALNWTVRATLVHCYKAP